MNPSTDQNNHVTDTPKTCSKFERWRTTASVVFSVMALADILLAAIPYRLPVHLYTYVEGVTPLSTDKVVVTALIGYLVTIFSIQAIMKPRQALRLTTLFQIHNVILSSGSALLLALMLEEIVPIWYKNGLHSALCDAESWTPVRLFTVPLTRRYN